MGLKKTQMTRKDSGSGGAANNTFVYDSFKKNAVFPVILTPWCIPAKVGSGLSLFITLWSNLN